MSFYERRYIVDGPTVQVIGHGIRQLILAHAAYPFLRWLLKPFTRHRNLTVPERDFNKVLSQARSTVQRDFGLLKTRWKCLLKKNEHELRNIPIISVACCVLHNTYQNKGEELEDEENNFLENLIANQRKQNRGSVCNEDNQQGDIITQFLQNVN